MSQKRQQEDATNANSSDDSGGGGGSGGTSNSFDKRRKLPKFKSVVHEVINMCRVKNYMEPVLEPLIRKVVREEVELAFRKYLISMKRNCGKDTQISETRNLQLQFQTRISLPVFTGAKIEGEDNNNNNNNSNLKLELIDSITGQIISNGIESSAKVEIVVLEGDFDNEEGENWTIEEFKNNIVKEREGKKSLLSGDLIVILKDGIGIINDISFTDNSSWTRSRKFRLGARIVENWNGIRVKEAKTESFIVRDHRGELYKKHHPPSLTDEVWRLEKIGKDGAFHKRLSRERVFTVKDFLILLFLDPTRLRNILGTGMSAKMWDIVIDHAQTCVLDYKAYVYYTSASQQKIGVVFNVVGQVIGLLSDDRYIASDKMSETEKDDARNLVISAFRHSDEVISFDDEASFLESFSRLSTTQNSPNLPIPMCGPGSSSGKTPQMSVASPNMIYSVADLDDYMDPMDVRFDPSLNFTSFSYEQDFLNNDMFEDHFDPFSIPSTSMEASSGNMFVGPTTVVTPDKAQRRWKMLFSVLRWFSIRRIVATKRTRVEAIQGGY